MDPTTPPPSYDEVVNDKPASGLRYQPAVNTTIHQPQVNVHQHIPSQVYYTSAGPQVNIPMQQAPTPTTFIVNPVNFGSHAQSMICPQCGCHILTNVKTESNWLTHIFAVGLFLMGCVLCSCLPYFMSSYNDISHYCPNCKAFIGMHSTIPCK